MIFINDYPWAISAIPWSYQPDDDFIYSYWSQRHMDWAAWKSEILAPSWIENFQTFNIFNLNAHPFLIIFAL